MNRKTFVRKLRSNMTDAERRLWRYLKGRQLHGVKFRRQHPIGNHILDFVSLEKELVLEIDGGQHSDSKELDFKRDERLRKKGFKVLRFWNHEVLENLTGVLEMIERNILGPLSNPPLSESKGREK